MSHQELARKLMNAPPNERKDLLAQNSELQDTELAKSLQNICYEIWTNEPQKVSEIVTILQELVAATENPLIRAYTEWTIAIENLVNGRLKDCLSWIDKSESSFKDSGDIQAAATTQISKLYALALLGQYDEAVACGLRARDVFIAVNDIYSAGKIEHNIGNLYWRRDLYRESKPFLTSAQQRFEQVGDQRQLAMVENCQAFVMALQNNFREAETIYQQALNRCVENNLTVTEAEIEIGLSNLYLFQGRLDLALKFMERSRQKYDLLRMPHQSANCELEIADIYLELNLLPEAIEFYQKVETKFAELGMQAELGRSLLNHAKALFLLDETETAVGLLEQAENLFEAEGNQISVASVKMAKVEIFFGRKNFQEAMAQAESALQTFTDGGNLRRKLLTEWLLGEIWRVSGETDKARDILGETLTQTINQLPTVEYLCLVSLGIINGDEKLLLKAIELIENSRSTLLAEEFRTAFFAGKTLAYNELVKLKLDRKNFIEAFLWHERSRSKTLLEAMNTAKVKTTQHPQLEKLREELNWFYSRINRQTSSGLEARQQVSELRKLAESREKEYAELARRLQINGNIVVGETQTFELKDLQEKLEETVLIEFASFDGRLAAFVITDNDFRVFQNLAGESCLNTEIRQFLFQIKTARFFEKLSPKNRQIAFERLFSHSQKIYDLLLRPLEEMFTRKRLTIVPTGFLHYLPFQALHDGESFLIEKKEISYAPSASVLQNCLNRKILPPNNALLVGVADKITPLVETEIETLSRLFPNFVKLLNENATLKNLEQSIPKADILHLACHGSFRLDNPDFSSLNLFVENLTVKDIPKLDLPNRLVTLSACETGLNKVVSGEELIGLTRGFLAAGASSLILSWWTVNDQSTLELMKNFYREFLNGNNPSQSLQTAQIQMLRANTHPYFWSPFGVIGHW